MFSDGNIVSEGNWVTLEFDGSGVWKIWEMHRRASRAGVKNSVDKDGSWAVDVPKEDGSDTVAVGYQTAMEFDAVLDCHGAIDPTAIQRDRRVV